MVCHDQSVSGLVARHNCKMAYDPSLGKTSEDFRFIFTDREAIGKNKSHDNFQK